MKRAHGFLLLATTVLLCSKPGLGAADDQAPNDPEAQYRKTIEARAGKIVAGLGIPDTPTATRVRDTIARQYFNLRKLHEVRDTQARAAAQEAGSDKSAANLAAQKMKQDLRPRIEKLHGEFLAELAKDLNVAQVEFVKDGMTYGVVPLTYGVYLKMYPTLTEEEKRQIKSWLTEAREIAMDQGTSEEKHAVFNQYKGKINNFLSRAGYDSRKGAENLRNQSQKK